LSEIFLDGLHCVCALPIKNLQRVIVTASNKISRTRLLGTQGASAMFNLNFAKVEFGIIERSPTE
jgi:hypothetical protein